MHFFLLIVLVLYLVVFHTSILILRSVVWVYFFFIFLMIFHFIYPFLNKWINLKFVFIFLFFLIHQQNALHPQTSLHTCNGNRFWTKQNILCNYESLFATDHYLHINNRTSKLLYCTLFYMFIHSIERTLSDIQP